MLQRDMLKESLKGNSSIHCHTLPNLAGMQAGYAILLLVTFGLAILQEQALGIIRIPAWTDFLGFRPWNTIVDLDFSEQQ